MTLDKNSNLIDLYSTEPEGLFPDYRKETTLKIAQVMTAGECFRIVSGSGMGKSKYLRYISSSKLVYKKYFANLKVKLLYFDLNRVYTYDTKSLVAELNNYFSTGGEGLFPIEGAIAELLKSNKKVYLILDQAEKLNLFSSDAIRLLRSIRDQYKYQFSFILSFETAVQVDDEKLKYLMNITPLKIDLGPLGEDEVDLMIYSQCKNLGIILSTEEIQKIKNHSGGVPRVIKMMISQKVTEGFVSTPKSESKSDEAKEKIISQEKKSDSTRPKFEIVNPNEDMKEIQKIMTKNEYMFFQELYINNGSIVTRDELATLVSPESGGDGVSNEAIDQIISRVRKVITKNKLPYIIYNKRGVGYYLENKN